MLKSPKILPSRLSPAELRDSGRLVLVLALIMFGVVLARFEIPPARADLVERTGEPTSWTIEEEPQKVRFAINGTDFSYDVLAGDVDAVVESLHGEGSTTVLHAPVSSLWGLLFRSGPTIWEVRHGAKTVRSYADIVQSRNLNSLGTLGLALAFAVPGCLLIITARRRMQMGELPSSAA